MFGLMLNDVLDHTDFIDCHDKENNCDEVYW